MTHRGPFQPLLFCDSVIWEDLFIGRVLQPWGMGDLHPWRVARLSYKATAAPRWYQYQPCCRWEVGPTKGTSHVVSPHADPADLPVVPTAWAGAATPGQCCR